MWSFPSHTKIVKFIYCSYCGKNFENKYPFRVHGQIHTGISGHYCSYCRKSLKDKNSLKVHKYRSHEQSGHRPAVDTSPRSPITSVGNVSLAVQDIISSLTQPPPSGKKNNVQILTWAELRSEYKTGENVTKREEGRKA